MSELTPRQAMENHVSHARAQLNDGALVQETLEYLWRVAYAAGVKTGQAPPEQRNLTDRALKIELASADGWKWGPWWSVLIEMKVGQRFTYGGCDRHGPNCSRNVVVLAPIKGRNWMQFDDTAERCRIPAVCWVKAISAPAVVEEGVCG